MTMSLSASSTLLAWMPQKLRGSRCLVLSSSCIRSFTGGGVPSTRLPHHQKQSLTSTVTSSASSSSSGAGSGSGTSTSIKNDKPPKQPFVQGRIRPGEWDEERTDPLYRPKFRSQSRIVSVDDYNKRPKVGFSGEFDSIQDAMVTLCWLGQKEQREIYETYIHFIQHAYQKFHITSHEYIIRVMAQRYQMTPMRIAGIIQLQHNEEQIKRTDPSRVLLTEAADYMDSAINQEIDYAYRTFRLKRPESFVENPMVGSGPSKKMVEIFDVFDMDQLLQDAIIRDEERARVIIDDHVYVEDVYEDTIPIPISKDCYALLTAHDKFIHHSMATTTTTTNTSATSTTKQAISTKIATSSDSKNGTSTTASTVGQTAVGKDSTRDTTDITAAMDGKQEQAMTADPLSDTDEQGHDEKKSNEDQQPESQSKQQQHQQQRDRYIFMAQIINTREVKQQQKGLKNSKIIKSKINQNHHHSYILGSCPCPESTLVEYNGTLRTATLADIRKVAWRPLRDVTEFLYRNVQKGWMDRITQGNIHSWGPAPARVPASVSASPKSSQVVISEPSSSIPQNPLSPPPSSSATTTTTS